MKRDLEEVPSGVLCKNISQPEVQEMIIRLFDVIMNQDTEIQRLKQSVSELKGRSSNDKKTRPYMPGRLKDLLY
jgi:hypothetical protein